MKSLLIIKPLRLNYLVHHFFFVLILGAISFLPALFLDKDSPVRFSGGIGVTIGIFFGLVLLWIYDEITKFERLSFVLTENAIMTPKVSSKTERKTILFSDLDQPRTIAYNSENKLHNRIRYTLWSTNGDSITISRLSYGRVQLNSLLEKIGLPKIEAGYRP